MEDIIRRSEEESEGAAKLLQLWGYLESRDDWYELFLWSLCWEQAPSWLPQVADTEVVFLVTLKLLLEFSLVEQNADGESYSMHPVVHCWIREVVNRNEDDGKPLHTAVATVGLWSNDGWEAEFLAAGCRRLPHAIRISQHSFLKDRLDLYPYDQEGNAYLRGRRNTGSLCSRQDWHVEAEIILRKMRALVQGEEGVAIDIDLRFATTDRLALCLAVQKKYIEADNLSQ